MANLDQASVRCTEARKAFLAQMSALGDEGDALHEAARDSAAKLDADPLTGPGLRATAERLRIELRRFRRIETALIEALANRALEGRIAVFGDAVDRLKAMADAVTSGARPTVGAAQAFEQVALAETLALTGLFETATHFLAEHQGSAGAYAETEAKARLKEANDQRDQQIDDAIEAAGQILDAIGDEAAMLATIVEALEKTRRWIRDTEELDRPPLASPEVRLVEFAHRLEQQNDRLEAFIALL